MLRGDLKKLEALARKNAAKAKKEIEEMEKKGIQNRNVKQLEKKRIQEDLNASEAKKIFNDAKGNFND